MAINGIDPREIFRSKLMENTTVKNEGSNVTITTVAMTKEDPEDMLLRKLKSFNSKDAYRFNYMGGQFISH